MKRGTDHNWQIICYNCDIAFYARCNCGYSYRCSINKQDENGNWTLLQEITILHNYYPHYDARKKRYNEKSIKIIEKDNIYG